MKRCGDIYKDQTPRRQTGDVRLEGGVCPEAQFQRMLMAVYADNHPGIKQETIAQLFGVHQTTVSIALRQYKRHDAA